MNENENWVGVTPDPPESLTGVVPPADPVHYQWTPRSIYTACGIAIAQANIMRSTDSEDTTCDECIAYLFNEESLARRAHDCTRDGHEYEMIQTGAGDVIAMSCPQCNSRWKVEPA